MAMNFQVNTYEIDTIRDQIRECFGRVVYSHKTHEKCADICLERLNHLKSTQIILSAVTSGSFLVTITGSGRLYSIIGAIFSIILLAINLYMKNYDLGKIAQQHKEAADKLWDVRESYLSLLVDMNEPAVKIDEIKKIRDRLQKLLSTIYSQAPRTNSKAYKKAQKALKIKEDMTFTNAEIDAFLPQKLRSAITN